MENIGHWIFSKEFEIENFVGFVYCITHKSTNRKYIGKKFFWKTIRKPIKNRKNRKRITKESDWKIYMGSSKWLLSEIEKFGKEQFEFQILSLHESKSTLAWEETRLLVVNDALRAKLPDGTKKFYNGLICGIKYEVKDETDLEKQFKI